MMVISLMTLMIIRNTGYAIDYDDDGDDVDDDGDQFDDGDYDGDQFDDVDYDDNIVVDYC